MFATSENFETIESSDHTLSIVMLLPIALSVFLVNMGTA